MLGRSLSYPGGCLVKKTFLTSRYVLAGRSLSCQEGCLTRQVSILIAKKVVDLSVMLSSLLKECLLAVIYEPRYEKTGFLHMHKQRRRSASR